MQQLFPDACATSTRRPLMLFPLPRERVSLPDTPSPTDTRKRSRSPGQPEDDADSAPPAAPLCLTWCERAALAGLLHYGDQPTTAADCFRRRPLRHDAPTPTPSTAGATSYRWCDAALRQAMALLRRVVQLDTAGVFLGAASGTSTTTTTTLEWYCRYQALELELEDVTLRASAVAAMEGAPAALRQQVTADVEATVRCVAGAVDALEATLIEMVLPLQSPPRLLKEGGGSGASAKTSAAPSLEYTAAIVRGLSEVLQAEQWPSRVLCSTSSGSGTSGSDTSPTCDSNAVPSSSTQLAAALLGEETGAATANTIGSPPSAASAALLRAQVGGATTSIALQSLLMMRTADVCNILGAASASPFSRVAALGRLKSAPRGGVASLESAAPPLRPALDLEQLDFNTVVVRAWNHGYALVGLQRLRFEMRCLFYRHATAAAGDLATGEVYALWCQWEATLCTHYRAFMQKVSTADTPQDDLTTEMRDDGSGSVDACALMRRHAVADETLAEVQRIAIRVVAQLQTMDMKGWFAVPAFDLVNVDFTSLRYWICSPSFAHKSRREAFRSLCRVLERMVDRCVYAYGPTHAFSDVITNIRQQLVDVARGEGLL